MISYWPNLFVTTKKELFYVGKLINDPLQLGVMASFLRKKPGKWGHFFEFPSIADETYITYSQIIKTLKCREVRSRFYFQEVSLFVPLNSVNFSLLNAEIRSDGFPENW